MSVLALDLGATFVKAARVDPTTGLIGPSVRRPFPAFAAGLPGGRREVSLEKILAAVHAVLDEVLRDAPVPRRLYLCGQMHGLVLVAPDGSGLSNFSSWQDERALEPVPGSAGTIFDVLRNRLGSRVLIELGNELRAGFPLAKLYAMAVCRELPAKAAPLSLPDWVAHTLCNRTGKPATDATNGAAHGALNVASRAWHLEALEALGLDHLAWPEILPTGTPIGNFSYKGNEISVHVPIGDQQAALFGANLKENELSLNIATGSQVSMWSAESSAGAWQLRPYVDNRWLRTITHLPAGRALNALVGLVSELAADQGTPLKDPWAQIERLVAATPSTCVRTTLAFFPCAVGDRGAIEQLTEGELRVGPLFRAAFQSMAANYRAAAMRLAPHGWSRIVLSGGLVQKSEALRQEILLELGSDHRLASHSEDTLVGLMQLAMRYEG